MPQRKPTQLLVLADDFSGAAEIAGIAFAFGLKTRLISRFEVLPDEDVLLINTDTRSLAPEKALEQLDSIIQDFPLDFNFLVFKKIDSVLRGHIIPEIQLLQKKLKFKRVFVLPANPSKDRKIISGKYYVRDIPLHQTSFAEDPYFPIRSSDVTEIISANKIENSYDHLSSGSIIPDSGIISGDVEKAEDLDFYLRQMNKKDLLCGAADSFSRFLARHFGTEQIVENIIEFRKYQVVLNGSSVKNEAEKTNLQKADFSMINCPAHDHSTQILQFNEWLDKVIILLQEKRKVAVEIPHPVVQSRTAANNFLQIFTILAKFIIKNIDPGQIHFWLTGGETAAAVIAGCHAEQLELIAQLSPGNVTFKVIDQKNLLITVKPGSYLWPDHLYNLK